MVDYSLIYEGLSEDGKTFYTRLNSNETKKVYMRVFNTYFNYGESGREIIMSPGLQYWNYVVNNTKDRYVEFRDAESLEIVGLFGLDGDKSCEDYDYMSYSKKVFNELNKSEKKSVISIFNEIVCQDTYWNDWVDIEENDVVVDIGFNYGLFSTISMIKKPSRIIGFEPNPRLVKLFTKYVSDSTIEIYNYAVSDKNSKISFYENDNPAMSTIKKDFYPEFRINEVQVDVISINSLIEKFELQKIDYLKVDCEGSEFDIFNSIDEDYLTNNIRKIAIEFHDSLDSENVNGLINKLNNCGFLTKIKNEEGVHLGMIYAKK